jgi:hypothetical protein
MRALASLSTASLARTSTTRAPFVRACISSSQCQPQPQQRHRRNFQTTTKLWREVKSASKVYSSADEAVADIQSGAIVLSAGFGLCGTAETIIKAMHKRGAGSLNNLTAVSNNAGTAVGGG